MSELPSGFEWNILDQIKLNECEIRLRNANTLRAALIEQIVPFAERHVLNPWQRVRPQAVEIMVASDACLNEYRAIKEDAAKIVIPVSNTESEARRKAVVTEATMALEAIEPVLLNITFVISEEDARG